MYICVKCGNRITMREGKPFMCFHCHTMQESDFVYYTEDFCIDLYNEYSEFILRRNPQTVSEWRKLRSEFGESKGLKPHTIKLLTYFGSVLPGARRYVRESVCLMLKCIAENKQDSKKEN